MSVSVGDLMTYMPECGLTCLVNAITNNSTCDVADTTCTCASTAITNAATLCITAACSVKEGLASKNLTERLCGAMPDSYDPYFDVYIAFTTITGVAVLLRVISRVLGNAQFWWDDYFNIVAMITSAAYTTVGLVSRNFGQGDFIWFVPSDDITKILQTFYVNFMFYVIARGFTRLSILTFYQRIFRIPSARPWILITSAVTIVQTFVFLIVCAFQCTPVSYFWNQWDGAHEGHCISTGVIFWVCAIFTIILDTWIIVIPLPFIARLKLPLKQRIYASIMFVIGIISLAISIARTNFINEFTASDDITYDARPVAAWSLLEIDVGIVCACLPSIQALLRPLWKSAFDSSERSQAHALPDEDPSASTSVFSASTKRFQYFASKLGVTSSEPPLPEPGMIVLTTTIVQDVQEDARHSMHHKMTQNDVYLRMNDLESSSEREGRDYVQTRAWA